VKKTMSIVIRPETRATAVYDWGIIRMLVDADISPRASFGTVTTSPGNQGHDLHGHAGSDEIIYIVSGEGLYLTDTDEDRPVRAGDCIFVPAGVKHATVNTGEADLRVIIVYTPSGPDRELDGIGGFRGFA
jgi:oxalate decarboxylase/phosphoglucose isomerase-like protein (cupin superfamily)